MFSLRFIHNQPQKTNVSATDVAPLSTRSRWALFCCVSLGYLVAAEIGHAMSFSGYFATFWLPAGLAVATYLAVRPRYWAILLFATLTANIASDVGLHDKHVFVSLGFWVANTTEAMIAVALIRRFDSASKILQTVRSALTFVLLVCVVSTAAGATLGAAVVWKAFGASYANTWRIWWSADYVGMLVTFPFVWIAIDAYANWKQRRRQFAVLTGPVDKGMYLGLLVALAAASHYVFGIQLQRMAYIVFPILLWLVMRFEVVGAASGLFVLALIAVADTAGGKGFFGGIEALPERAFALQSYLFVSATTFLTLAATVRERQDAEHRLRMSQFTIEKASNAQFWIREDGSFAYANELASRYLGYSREELCQMSIADVNPDFPDDAWASHWNETKHQGELRLASTYRRRNGTTFDCELQTVFVDFDGEEVIVASVQDISARKAAERDLYRSQTALHTAADAVLWVKPDGHIFYVNDEACVRLMYSREDLLNLTVADINPDLESVEKFRGEIWPRIHHDKRLMLTMRHERRDGTIFPVEIVIHHIEFEGEEFACSFVRDITARVAAEKELDEARARLELAISGGNIGLWDWDVLSGDVHFSDHWHSQLGESPGTLKTFNDWEVRLHPDDADEARAVAQDALAKRKPDYQSTFRLKHKDGSYRWILSRGRLSFDSDGKPNRMVGTHVDVTELQETRAKLEALIELLGVTDGAWNWDLLTDSVDYSTRFRELLGYAADDYDGFPNELNSFKQRIHPDDSDSFWDQIQQHQKNGQPMDLEVRMRRKDGVYRWFRARGAMLRDDDRKQFRMAGSIYDVTHRKNVELQLLESNSDLEQFAYVASHDLQEPLRAVGGFCQLLQRRYSDSLDETARGYIAKAVEGASRMTTLIDDLLEFSRVGNDKRPLKMICMKDVVAAAMEQMQLSIEESGAQITVEDLPMVAGDAQLLAQLFQNLISNAVKFRQQNIPPRIRIFATRTELFWDVSVEDNGIGIRADHIKQTFTIFKRLHRREEIPGTGIGLAICKRIADRHNGTISVSSTPGKGSVFTLRLAAEEQRYA